MSNSRRCRTGTAGGRDRRHTPVRDHVGFVWACCAAGLLLLMASASGTAGEFNPTLNIGDVVPVWADLLGIDGQRHSAEEHPADRLLLVVFTCNSCPIARDYEDRLIEFTREHAGEVDVVAINVNLIAEDSLERMQARAKERRFNFPYLFDESQQIARDFGANGTPEFFLMSKSDGASPPSGPPVRKLLYQGAMDDSAIATNVTKQHLRDAVAAALNGQPAPTLETYAHGCRIRYQRERRRE